jgi:hypothetical protein
MIIPDDLYDIIGLNMVSELNGLDLEAVHQQQPQQHPQPQTGSSDELPGPL